MRTSTKVCGIVKRRDQMSWPFREEISFTFSARSVFSLILTSYENTHAHSQIDLLPDWLVEKLVFSIYLFLPILSVMMNNTQLVI